jgi:molybdopterin converting factor small subunit
MNDKEERIYFEEKVRLQCKLDFEREILKSQSIGKKFGKGIIKFINSGVVLWLLSFLLVTVFYKSCVKRLEEERLKIVLAHKLDTEISRRLTDFLLNVNQGQFSEAMDYLINENPDVVIFPEFRNRILYSLLWELGSVVSDEEKSEIEVVMKIIEKIKQKKGKEEFYEIASQELKEFLVKIKKKIYNLKRWDLGENKK